MDITKSPSKKKMFSLLIEKGIELLNADMDAEIKLHVNEQIENILESDYNKITKSEIENMIKITNNYIRRFEK